jgi:hypothetical protein
MKSMFKSFATLVFLVGFAYQAPLKCESISDSANISMQDCNGDISGGAYVTFAGKFGGEINKNEIQSTTELGIAGCAVGSKIYKFNLIIESRGETVSYKGESYVLSEEILKSLRSLQQGDTFEFTEIKAHLPNGGKIDALGRKYTIV